MEVVDDVEAVVLAVDNEGPGELLTMRISGVIITAHFQIAGSLEHLPSALATVP